MMQLEKNRLKRDLNAWFQANPAFSRAEYDLDAEVDFIDEILHTQVGKSLNGRYEYTGVAGVGASGTVLVLTYLAHKLPRAAKFPRKKVLTQEQSKDALIGVEMEVHGLSKASHRNISRFFEYLKADPHHYTVITQHIPRPNSLTQWLLAECDTRATTVQSVGLASTIEHLILTLARLLLQVCDALTHLHTEAKVVHMDVKPSNILVSDTGVPFLIDLGLARDKEKYSLDEQVRVGFTWRYAHPRLSSIESGARVSSTPDLAKTHVRGRELTDLLDIFALGRSILELLKLIEKRFGAGVHSYFAFNYLHLVACLSLDGYNSEDRESEHFSSSRTWNLGDQSYKVYAFRTCHSIATALEKLLGTYRIETDIPELDAWYPHVVNASDFAPVPLTPRVQSLIDHPAFKRLKQQKQLGLLDSVYPTATHTRYVHALGTFRTTCDYILALYYDPENPTFRILITPNHLTPLLAASLVHDLGQTSLGHDVEELGYPSLSHTRLTALCLEDEKVTDVKGRTIPQLLSEPLPRGWGLLPAQVLAILSRENAAPLEYALYDILDSALDADKMDYLRRDSVEARVPYGLALDYPRLLRTLTTAAAQQADVGPVLRLAIKSKGLAGAEAFSIARYQLFQAVYWHHTYRAIKAMLLAAFADGLEELPNRSTGKFQLSNPFEAQQFGVLFYRAALLADAHFQDYSPDRVTAAEYLRQSKGKKQTAFTNSLLASWAESLTYPDRARLASAGADTITLLFYYFARPEGRALIEDVLRRRVYKRLFERPLIAITPEKDQHLAEFFKGTGRYTHSKALAALIKDRLRAAIQDASKSRPSVQVESLWGEVERIYLNRLPIVIDLPTRGVADQGKLPPLVLDLERKYFRPDQWISPKIESPVWEVVPSLMRKAATFRVFCDPQLHDIIRNVMTGDDVAMTVSGYFKKVFA